MTSEFKCKCLTLINFSLSFSLVCSGKSENCVKTTSSVFFFAFPFAPAIWTTADYPIPSNNSVFTTEWYTAQACRGVMRLASNCADCQSHFLVTYNLRSRQSHLKTLRTNSKSTVFRNSHRVGQLFRFGLIGDMQAGQHKIVIR